MTARSTSTTSTTSSDTAREIEAAATPLPEMSRQQYARSVDWLASAFRTGEALQQVNLQMSQRAALLHSQAADNARKASTPLELLQIQSTLLMYEWQEMTRYSQELMLAWTRAAGQPGQASTADKGTPATSSAMSGFADAAMGAAGPMVQAWQQMMTGTMHEAAQQKH